MSLTPAQMRSLFPALPRLAYLNAAAASPLCAPVYEAAEAHLREQREQGDLGFLQWLARKESLRERFARLIRASPGELAFVPSTSFGFNLVAQLLWQLGVREVVTLADEFPSSTLPLLHQGLRLRVVRPREDGRYTLEDLADAVGPDTRAVVASAVQYASGFRLDVAGTARLCRDRNLFFALNAAHALGQVPVDVSPGVDFLCGTSHKWLMGGFGVGLFFAREALFSAARLPVAGWLSVESPMAMDNLVGARVSGRDGAQKWFTAEGARFRGDVTALEVGVTAFAPLFGAGEALSLLERLTLPVVEAHIFALQTRLRGQLRAKGFRPVGPFEEGLGSGICTFPVSGDPTAAAVALAGEGVVVSVRGSGLRVATHVFNDEEDVERLLAALERLNVRPA